MVKSSISTAIACGLLSISAQALSPEEALNSFELHPDFTIELVAS